MRPFPHRYSVETDLDPLGSVELTAERLPTIVSAPPVEFDGPGDQWSPEDLLVASVLDCFVLTFRAVAQASRLEWSSLRCRAEGSVDRVEHVTRFVSMRISADLALPEGGNRERAERLLEKAEKACLVTNTVDLSVELEANITVEG